MPPDEQTFLSTKLLAKRWHRSPRTLERWRYERKGPAWIVIGGGGVLYPLPNILACEAEGLVDPKNDPPKRGKFMTKQSRPAKR